MKNTKIEYESKITKKDMSFIVTKKAIMDPILLISRLVFEVAGIGLILWSILGYYNEKLNLALAIVLGIIGFYLFAIDPFVNHIFKVNSQYKNSLNNCSHYMTVDNDYLSLVIKDGSDKPLTYKYRLNKMDVVFKCKDTIYLHLANSKKFFVFHREDFITGSFTELIELLKSKNIKISNR